MTIEDLLNAGITLQGFLTIKAMDDKTDEMKVVYEGDGEAVDYEKNINRGWFKQKTITYIYPDCAGVVIEVA